MVRVAVLVLTLSVGSTASARAQLAGDTVVRGLQNPVAVIPDPADRSILFVVQQNGLIRVVRDGSVLEEPFLDLRATVTSGGERGLLGLAFAPDAAESRRFFVNFTDGRGDTVVARFTRRADRPLTADPATRVDLIWPDGRRAIAQPFANHNGGHLAFGPDGMLYIGLGDGGSAGDPFNHAQNPQSLLGKMLRLDVSVPDDDPRGYRIPEDNPFLDSDPLAALHEIWAFGLRNPWRYSFDDWTRGGTSALVVADVGQNAREEINFEPAGRGGRNYGWRLREGRQGFDARLPAAYGPLTEPIHDYGRSIGASVTGGFVYRGAALDPSFHGRYFFADFISGRLFSLGLHLHPETGEASADDEREHTATLGGRSVLGMISAFGVDHDGELLVVNYAGGTIVRMSPDLAIVPAAPALRPAVVDEAFVTLAWDVSASGAAPVRFAVERLRQGVVVERLSTARFDVRLDWSETDCFRVRAEGSAGWSGPPSAPTCPSDHFAMLIPAECPSPVPAAPPCDRFPCTTGRARKPCGPVRAG